MEFLGSGQAILFGLIDRVVLNPNVSADESLYRERSARTSLLLGTDYALIRDEFRNARPEAPRAAERATRILVTLGGSDAANVTDRVLGACAFLPDPSLRFRVVIGPSNRNAARFAEQRTDSRIEFVHDATIEGMR